MSRRKDPDLSDPKVLIGLGFAGFVVASHFFRQLAPAERAASLEASRRDRVEREERERAVMEKYRREQRESRAKDIWFDTGPGRELFEEATARTEPVRPPFPDLEQLPMGVGYPTNRYGWQSAAAQARFTASYDYISARGWWSLDRAGQTVDGEFADGREFKIFCPEGTFYLSPEQRDAILRLVSGPGGATSVRFVRHFDWHAVRDRLWREHGPG